MYHPVVSSHKKIPQTNSQQPAFYFGGSQVPLEVGELKKGKGLPIKPAVIKPAVINPDNRRFRILPYNVK